MDDGSDSSLWQRLTRIFSGKTNDSVEQAIREASEEGELAKDKQSMLLNILTLDDLQVQEIMTPRIDIACASDQATVEEIINIIISSGHSRIPIYKEHKDDFIGVIYAKDLLQYCIEGKKSDIPAPSTMREPFFVPETKKVLDLLHEFQVKKTHLAIILDEFGGTTGLVSIEDVLEEIVGEIEDEHDAPRQDDITQEADGAYLISGRTYLEDVNEILGVDISSEEVDTIGGFILHIAGRVPKKGESFLVGPMCFVIVDADARQIHSIRAYAQNHPMYNEEATTASSTQ